VSDAVSDTANGVEDEPSSVLLTISSSEDSTLAANQAAARTSLVTRMHRGARGGEPPPLAGAGVVVCLMK
jgi:hypothetical protein